MWPSTDFGRCIFSRVFGVFGVFGSIGLGIELDRARLCPRLGHVAEREVAKRMAVVTIMAHIVRCETCRRF